MKKFEYVDRLLTETSTTLIFCVGAYVVSCTFNIRLFTRLTFYLF